MVAVAEKVATKLSRRKPSTDLVSSFRHDNIPDNINSVYSKPNPQLVSPGKVELPPGLNLELIDAFNSKFTRTHKFKYRLEYEGIPIYGSSVIVERGDDDKVLFTDSHLVDQDETIIEKFPLSEPTIQESALGELLEKHYFHQGNACSFENYDINPSLYYYFERYENGSSQKIGQWRLVYVTDIKLKQDVRNNLKKGRQNGIMDSEIQPLPESVDYIINAHPKDVHSLEIIAKLSLIRTFC